MSDHLALIAGDYFSCVCRNCGKYFPSKRSESKICGYCDNGESTVYIGIDPGVTGAIGMIGDDWQAVHDLPIVEMYGRKTVDIGKVFTLCDFDCNRLIMIETPLWFKHDGRNPSSLSWYNFGRLTSSFANWNEVSPVEWKKYMGLTMAKSASVTERKHASLNMARMIFPALLDQLSYSKHHNRAEALLIAEYARIVRNDPVSHEILVTEGNKYHFSRG